MIEILLKLLLLIFLSMNAFSNQLDDPNTWRPITDQVMGGISKLLISHNDGVFTMTGEVSTENNGGFVRLSNRIDITDNDFKGITNPGTYAVGAKTDESATASESLLNVRVSSGKAFVKGYEVENLMNFPGH